MTHQMLSSPLYPLRVAGLLFAQLTLTTVIGATIIGNPGVKAFMESSPAILFASFAVSMGTLLVFCFSTKARCNHGTDLALCLLFIHTCHSYRAPCRCSASAPRPGAAPTKTMP